MRPPYGPRKPRRKPSEDLEFLRGMRDGLKILSTAQLSSPRFKSGLRRDSYPESVKVKYKKHRRYIRVDLSKVVEGSTCHEMDREDSQLFDAAVDPEMKP